MKTRVLGNWQPGLYMGEDICRYRFRQKLESFGFKKKKIGQISLWIYPNDYDLTKEKDILEWHHDDEDNPGYNNYYMIVWSNIYPTEIKPKLATKDGDIILIRNREVEHRMPKIPDGVERWFMRANLND